MSSFLQAQAEGLCLRYPENLGLHQSITYENAVGLLLRAITLSQQVPFTWGFIDKPPEGQIYLLFLTILTSFPLDGIRYQEQETRFVIPVGSNRELEVCEVKYGFIPNSQDTAAWRGRRRYRLHKGGHPQLVLVHYFRGPYAPILPNLVGQPARGYPLRQINEPAIFVMGEKMGQKVFAHAGGGPPPVGMGGGSGGGIGGISSGTVPPPPQTQQPPPPTAVMGPTMSQGGGGPPAPGMHPTMSAAAAAAAGIAPLPMNMNMSMHTQQAMLAQQNSSMESLERRRERERARERGAAAAAAMAGRAQPPRIDDDDSADEADHISTRTLAMTRYKRNHELMNLVFYHAAFGDSPDPAAHPPSSSPYVIFNPAELEEKAVKLSADIDEMQKRASERAQARLVAADPVPSDTHHVADMSIMDDTILGNGITV